MRELPLLLVSSIICGALLFQSSASGAMLMSSLS